MENVQMKTYPGMLVFTHAQFGEIRVMYVNDEPWYVAADITRAMGYKNATKALVDHVNGEDLCLFGGPNKTSRKQQSVEQNVIVQLAQEQNLGCHRPEST